MKKILNIAWKDLIIIFRDPGALLLMLGAPFLLTLGMGLVTGAFSDNDSSTGLADIPVVIVNEDGGELGNTLTDLFLQDDLADFARTRNGNSADDSPSTSRRRRNRGRRHHSRRVSQTASSPTERPVQRADAVAIEVYSNPGRPISASVIQSIVNDFVTEVDTRAGGGGSDDTTNDDERPFKPRHPIVNRQSTIAN